jgi:sigma-B regulation protein RsbU (phosphoserine phosphatase)
LAASEPVGSRQDDLRKMTSLALAEKETLNHTIEVLIVEDTSPMRRLMGIWVQNLGYRVHLAANGREALAILAQSPISIVICDWIMPEMDGLALCREIRKSKPDHYIYVILITGRSLESDFIEAMNAGADDFAQKPLDHDQLSVRLRAARRVIELEQGLKAEHERLHLLYRQMQSDLLAAARLQKELLPADRSYGSINLRSLLVPASVISGDCHNHFALPGGKILAYQADIAGHGITAALLSVALQRALTPSFCCGSNGELLQAAQIVKRLNARLLSNTDTPEYFTLFLVIVSPDTGMVSFCQAGHPRPVLLRADGSFEWIGDSGFPVAMIADVEYEEGSCQIAPGDRLMIFSDGILECPAPSGDQLGSDRLLEMFRRAAMNREAGVPSTEMQILQLLSDWHGHHAFPDDVSVLSINAGC